MDIDLSTTQRTRWIGLKPTTYTDRMSNVFFTRHAFDHGIGRFNMVQTNQARKLSLLIKNTFFIHGRVELNGKSCI